MKETGELPEEPDSEYFITELTSSEEDQSAKNSSKNSKPAYQTQTSYTKKPKRAGSNEKSRDKSDRDT